MKFSFSSGLYPVQFYSEILNMFRSYTFAVSSGMLFQVEGNTSSLLKQCLAQLILVQRTEISKNPTDGSSATWNDFLAHKKPTIKSAEALH